MKRIMVMVLALALIPAFHTVAQAEITPDWFLFKNGIIVLDEDSLKADNFDPSQITSMFDFSFCLFGYNIETYGNLIFWIKDHHMNCGIDFSALLMDGTKQKNYTMKDTFVEMCYTFPFDVYAFGDMNDLYFLGKDEYLNKMRSIARYSGAKLHYLKDYKQFFSELENHTSGF